MEQKLLIVDDEEGVRNSLQEYFRREGFEVTVAEDGNQGLEILKHVLPDVVILDVQLKGIDGYRICQMMRQQTDRFIGIIMISGSKKEMVDRVVGLEVGADTYMTKPFETRELLAQVRALLRRMEIQNKHGNTSGWFVVDDYLRIHFDRRLVEARGKEVQLSRLEFDLLKYLVQHPGIPCGRSDLVDIVWGYEAGGDISDGSVNTCIARLRKLIERDPANPVYIQSVHGIGYRFKEI